MRSRFEEQLQDLKNQMIGMGMLCESAILLTANVLKRKGKIEEHEIRRISQQIDEKEKLIENLCLRLLLLQQPVAKDLRRISSALKMITDMERIGDQAEDIAEIIGYLDEDVYFRKADSQINKDLIEMANRCMFMVKTSIDAYVNHDMDMANQVILHDDMVDDLFVRLKKQLIDLVVNQSEQGELALDLLMIAKYLERIADHAVNIAEWVEFAITGVHKNDNDKHVGVV